MSVQRIRAEYRRQRRTLRMAQDELDEAIEDLADAVGDGEGTEAVLLASALEQLQNIVQRLQDKLAQTGLRLDDAREERQKRRREAWQDVRAALQRFGPALLDVLGDVLAIQAAPREERLAQAVSSLLDHSDIPLTEQQIDSVALLADQIVGALDG